MGHCGEVCSIMGNLERNSYVIGRLTKATLSLLESKHLRDVSVSEIVETAQVSRNSFYRNFAEKEDVLRRHVRNVTDDFLASSGLSFRSEPFDQYLVKLFTHFQENRGLCELLLREGEIHLVQEEFERVFAKNYENVYDEFRSRFYAGGIYSIFLLWLQRGCRETPEELAHRLAGMLDGAR